MEYTFNTSLISKYIEFLNILILHMEGVDQKKEIRIIYIVDKTRPYCNWISTQIDVNWI